MHEPPKTYILYCPFCGSVFYCQADQIKNIDMDFLFTDQHCSICLDVPLMFFLFCPGAWGREGISSVGAAS